MDYEKKYKEALEKARQLCAYPTTKPFISDLQDLFPELKGNKREWIEKIRQELISYLGNREVKQISESDAILQWISWLEKQGEQNDKIHVTEKLYEHIRNACACIEDAFTCDNIKDMIDYLNQANYDVKSAFDMVEK